MLVIHGKMQRFALKSRHLEVSNLTAVLDEETRDIENLITYKYCLSNRYMTITKNLPSRVTLYKVVDGRHALIQRKMYKLRKMNKCTFFAVYTFFVATSIFMKFKHVHGRTNDDGFIALL